jgi:hypothetical protein
MNTTIINDRIQEECPVKPGHCLNPFGPLFDIDRDEIAENELALSLLDNALFIEEAYGRGELLDQLPGLVLDIKRNLTSWYEIGLIAWKIKLCKAWEKRYTSFKQFCETAIGKTSSAVNNWIRSARVMSQLISHHCDRLPMNPSIALELSKFGEDDLNRAWRDICNTYADHELTLDKVKAHLENPYQKMPNSKKINIPIESWERLREKAAEAGISPSKLLEELIDSLIPDDEEVSSPPDDDSRQVSEDDQVKTHFLTDCPFTNIWGDPEISDQELIKYGLIRVQTGFKEVSIMPISDIPLDTSDPIGIPYIRSTTGEVLPGYAQRYRDNFKIEPDGYYLKKDPVRRWELVNGFLEEVPY